VVDAAMVDGAAAADDDVLGVQGHGHLDRNERGTNLLDTGAHFYDTYECADGKYVSIGSIEPQFYAELLRLTAGQDPAPAGGPAHRHAGQHTDEVLEPTGEQNVKPGAGR
jgi:alpha-methylacyl-CoA racemase